MLDRLCVLALALQQGRKESGVFGAAVGVLDSLFQGLDRARVVATMSLQPGKRQVEPGLRVINLYDFVQHALGFLEFLVLHQQPDQYLARRIILRLKVQGFPQAGFRLIRLILIQQGNGPAIFMIGELVRSRRPDLLADFRRCCDDLDRGGGRLRVGPHGNPARRRVASFVTSGRLA